MLTSRTVLYQNWSTLQLSIDNHVIWDNVDDTAHTVTPDHRYTDAYSGDFGSTGVVKPGETYEFLFTEAPPNIPVTIALPL